MDFDDAPTDQPLEPIPSGNDDLGDEAGGDDQLAQQLAERFGVDEFDLSDLDTYQTDQKNWQSQQNVHNKRLAEAANDAEARRDQLLSKISERLDAPPAQQPQNPGDAKRLWAQHLGIDPEAMDEAMTFDQFYQAMGSVTNAYNAHFENVGEKLRAHDGQFETLGHDTKLAVVRAGENLAKDFIGSTLEQYPDANEDRLWQIINNPPEGDVEGALLAEAKSFHDAVAAKVGGVRTKEAVRRVKSRRAVTGAGRSGGGAVAGKANPSIFSDDGLEAFMRDNPMSGRDDEGAV